MPDVRLRLLDLVITGDTVPPASVRFAPGLNLVVGASDTGKTFIFEAIDFMLGAQTGLRRIPESAGYDRAFLSIDPLNHPPFTLRRGVDGGQFEASEHANGFDAPPTATKTLSPRHSADADGSLSAYLLRAIGMEGRLVRKNEKGERRALSFRDIAHLTLIGEERIIQQTSPVVTGQHTSRTAERNVFAYFLTGQDDSQIIPPESQEDKKARLVAEENVVEAILAEKQAELAALSESPDELPEQAARLEATIREVSQSVVATKEQISDLEQRRAKLFEERVALQSHTQFIDEQIKRFRLLDSYYQSDRDRLTAVVEASRIVHELPEGACPLCNRAFSPEDDFATTHAAFESACQSESDKIDRLRIDLQAALTDSLEDLKMANGRASAVQDELGDVDAELQRTMTPAVRTQQVELQGLIQQRTTIAHGETVRATVRSLQDRLERIRKAKAERPAKVSFENRATTSAAFEFCNVVEEILRAWKYPNLGTVSFDTDKADLVIGGQDRANKGKGYRAVTYAAFSIALMKYCRMKDIPHPGFVVLDTPLNPFKGPASSNPDDDVTDEVKKAFYTYLADDTSGDQFIIMENQEPPPDVRQRVTYYSFSKNDSIGRYGFFPRPTAGSA